ncbi:hypothetical protein [Glycomyces tenuis]|uniref:hypothetical protein n=1 Tax=Glycomyces tenuis TaxID=58116 RepID=UPI000411C59E|nr:hypothetical protein [Glycomyces tenuis]
MRWYLRKAQLADHLVTGERSRACPEPIDDVETSGFDSADEAWAWLALNRWNLLSFVYTANAEKLYFESWAIAEAMWAYFSRNSDDPALASCYEYACHSALKTNDLMAGRQLRDLMLRAGGRAKDLAVRWGELMEDIPDRKLFRSAVARGATLGGSGSALVGSIGAGAMEMVGAAGMGAASRTNRSKRTEDEEEDRVSWLEEDDDVFGSDTAPPVVPPEDEDPYA